MCWRPLFLCLWGFFKEGKRKHIFRIYIYTFWPSFLLIPRVLLLFIPRVSLSLPGFDDVPFIPTSPFMFVEYNVWYRGEEGIGQLNLEEISSYSYLFFLSIYFIIILFQQLFFSFHCCWIVIIIGLAPSYHDSSIVVVVVVLVLSLSWSFSVFEGSKWLVLDDEGKKIFSCGSFVDSICISSSSLSCSS